MLGALSLFLSGFLVVNTIAALMAQQVPQIGMMKMVGGRTPQIVQLYLSKVVMFGLLSLLIAVPLGALAADAPFAAQYLSPQGATGPDAVYPHSGRGDLCFGVGLRVRY